MIGNSEKAFEVVFWQNELSIHQAALVREFADLWPGLVRLIVNVGIPERRLSQGWGLADYGKALVTVSPTLPERELIVAGLSEQAVHIFSGLGREQTLRRSQKVVARSSQRIVFYLEPWDDRTLFRRVGLRAYYAARVVGGRTRSKTFLTTGERGIRQLRSIGIRKDRIYYFGYFLEASTSSLGLLPQQQETDQISITFVGQLDDNKQALRLAREAVKFSATLSLTIIGDGPYRNKLENLANLSNNNIRVLGPLSNETTREVLRKTDYLILPSKYDGWGAVISESLLEGTPVLVSTGCGSAHIVRSAQTGFRFRPSRKGIRAAFRFALLRGLTNASSRSDISSWADNTISGKAGAKYLRSILCYEFNGKNMRPISRPVAPWIDHEVAE